MIGNPNNSRRKALELAARRTRIKNHALAEYIRTRILRKHGRSV